METFYLLLKDKLLNRVTSLWAICFALFLCLDLVVDHAAYFFFVYISPLLALVLVVRTVVVLLRKKHSHPIQD